MYCPRPVEPVHRPMLSSPNVSPRGDVYDADRPGARQADLERVEVDAVREPQQRHLVVAPAREVGLEGVDHGLDGVADDRHERPRRRVTAQVGVPRDHAGVVREGQPVEVADLPRHLEVDAERAGVELGLFAFFAEPQRELQTEARGVFAVQPELAVARVRAGLADARGAGGAGLVARAGPRAHEALLAEVGGDARAAERRRPRLAEHAADVVTGAHEAARAQLHVVARFAVLTRADVVVVRLEALGEQQ